MLPPGGARSASGSSAPCVPYDSGVQSVRDKGAVAAACLLLVLTGGLADAVGVACLITAVAVCGLCSALDDHATVTILPAGYLLAACLSPVCLVGAPLASYDLSRAVTAGRVDRWVCAFGAPLAVMAVRWSSQGLAQAQLGLIAVTVPAVLLARRTAQQDALRVELHALRDDLHARLADLRASRARLKEAQDHQTRAAALAERTRIAREIHDGLGHQLTRLLLQVKALEVAHRDEPHLVADLAGVCTTAEEGLSSMRAGVHALSREGQDLGTELHVLGRGCGIEEVSVDCDLGQEPPAPVARCIRAVVREALTNAARHGRARSARVAVADYPGLWRVRVDNDGVPPDRPPDAARGIGLESMTERVEALGGTVRIIARPRFTVLATIPTEG